MVQSRSDGVKGSSQGLGELKGVVWVRGISEAQN